MKYLLEFLTNLFDSFGKSLNRPKKTRNEKQIKERYSKKVVIVYFAKGFNTPSDFATAVCSRPTTAICSSNISCNTFDALNSLS